MVLELFLWVPPFSMIICFAHSTLQVPQRSLTLSSVSATQRDHAKIFILCHSLEHACRHIIGLTLFVSFSLGLQFYVAYSPTSEIIESLCFPGFLDAYNVRKTLQSMLCIMARMELSVHSWWHFVVYWFCNFIYYLLKHFIYSHFTFHVWSFQYLKPLSI